jgi:hypothetical protein
METAETVQNVTDRGDIKVLAHPGETLLVGGK